MKIVQHLDGRVTVLSPQGPLIRSDARQLAEYFDNVMGEGSGQVVLDASKVAFVDSIGLEVLADATERLIRTGRTLKLAGANETVREVLELTELASLFEQFDSVEAAVGSFG